MSLETTFTGCNQKHAKYVPVKDFRKCYVPEGYQNQEMCEFIKAFAELTVKISVKFTSPNRPEVWPDTEVPYPHNDLWGTGKERVASGWVDQIVRYSAQENMDCRCADCRNSKSPSKEWGDITVVTATHSVFDRFEAESAVCRMFYDADDSTPVTLKGRTMAYTDVEGDRSALVCSTCDVALLEKLSIAMRLCEAAKKKVANIFKGPGQNLAMIVSHPHGWPKQISFGEWVQKSVNGDGRGRYSYSTLACPGSDGGPVVVLDNIGQPSYLPHSGAITAMPNSRKADNINS